MTKQTAANHPEATAIRAQVLRGIAGNRIPGLHFPGYFLDMALPRFDGEGVEFVAHGAPHTHDSNGALDLTVLCFLADTTLATATRSHVPPGARLATLHLQIQLTGLPTLGELRAHSHALGMHAGTAVRQLLSTATLTTAAGVVARATGEFAALDPPPGVALAPLPWQLESLPAIPALTPRDLDAHEQPILKYCNAALIKSARHGAFIEHFWGGLPVRTENGARARFAIGPHLTNRVGHVQGGISVGAAARCACSAAPAHMQLSNVAAWYISPGRGKALMVKSRVVHAGKMIAVVRTEVKTDGGARVLEVVTHHVARAHK